MSTIDGLRQKTGAMGWKVAVVPYAVRAPMIRQVANRRRRGELDERLTRMLRGDFHCRHI